MTYCLVSGAPDGYECTTINVHSAHYCHFTNT